MVRGPLILGRPSKIISISLKKTLLDNMLFRMRMPFKQMTNRTLIVKVLHKDLMHLVFLKTSLQTCLKVKSKGWRSAGIGRDKTSSRGKIMLGCSIVNR